MKISLCVFALAAASVVRAQDACDVTDATLDAMTAEARCTYVEAWLANEACTSATTSEIFDAQQAGFDENCGGDDANDGGEGEDEDDDYDPSTCPALATCLQACNPDAAAAGRRLDEAADAAACACGAQCDVSTCDAAGKKWHALHVVALECGKCEIDVHKDCFATCEAQMGGEPKDCAAVDAALALGGCAGLCPDCVQAALRANGAAGSACPAAADPCEGLKDKALEGCTAAVLIAPACKCIEHYDEWWVEMSKESSTHDAAGCKDMQPMFDCAKKEENWADCANLADPGEAKAKYSESVYAQQEEACGTLTEVSGASSTGSGILLGLSTLLALRLV
jgi:hypothetical protein